MRLFMFAVFIIVWAIVGLTLYYKKTNSGRKKCAYDALEEAQTISEMADAHLRAAEIARKASTRLSQDTENK